MKKLNITAIATIILLSTCNDKNDEWVKLFNGEESTGMAQPSESNQTSEMSDKRPATGSLVPLFDSIQKKVADS